MAINCAVSRTLKLLPLYGSRFPNEPPYQKFLKVRDRNHFQHSAERPNGEPTIEKRPNQSKTSTRQRAACAAVPGWTFFKYREKSQRAACAAVPGWTFFKHCCRRSMEEGNLSSPAMQILSSTSTAPIVPQKKPTTAESAVGALARDQLTRPHRDRLTRSRGTHKHLIKYNLKGLSIRAHSTVLSH